jgi:hypothetical protein
MHGNLRYFGIITLLPLSLFAGGCAPGDAAPVINEIKIPSALVAIAQNVELQCSASDADNDKLSYQWLASGGTFSVQGAKTIWTAPGDPGAAWVKVTVADGRGQSDTKEVNIQVTDNHAPEITCLKATPSAVGEGLTGILDCCASDAENEVLTYRWESSAGVITGSGSGVKWLAPGGAQQCSIKVVVSDASGGSASMEMNLDVLANHAPIIQSLKANPQTLTAGGSSKIHCEAIDPDSDTLIYTWTSEKGEVEGSGADVSWTSGTECAKNTITVVVGDGRGGEITQKLNITVVSKGG